VVNEEVSDDVLATEQIVLLPELEYFENTTEHNAINWLYPNGFNPDLACCQSILTVTNESVDKWNNAVQNLNPNEKHILRSHDTFADVDDPHGFLQQNLTPIILNEFNDPGSVPPHELHLKVWILNCFMQ
jgi:hypothetical protein